MLLPISGKRAAKEDRKKVEKVTQQKKYREVLPVTCELVRN